MNKFHSALLLLIVMVLASIVAVLLTPRVTAETHVADIEKLVPAQLGAWMQRENVVEQVSLSIADDPAEKERRLYDQMITRTYANPRGDRVMLAIAYTHAQNEELKIHRPELCYYAQGFAVKKLGESRLQLSSNSSVQSLELFAKNADRLEPITYWIRIGDRVILDPWAVRWKIFSEGMKGNLTDGILVRVSSLVVTESQIDDAFSAQREFIAALYDALTPEGKKMLVGS
jgi:EpsI family protein